MKTAIEVAEKLCDWFSEQNNAAEVNRLLAKVDDDARHSASLMAHKAWVLVKKDGDVKIIQSLMQQAEKVSPDLPIYDRVRREMKVRAGRTKKKASWWHW
jgi:hypothetical protein